MGVWTTRRRYISYIYLKSKILCLALNNIVYHFVHSNLWLRYFWKRGNIRKRVRLNRRLRHLHTLYWGFKKIPFTLYTYVLTKILQNGAKFIQKLTPGFKNHMRNLDNFRQAVESPKSWNLMGYFCPKNTFFQLKHYIQRIYLISPVIFETISHFSRHNSSVLFSSNITYFLQK